MFNKNPPKPEEEKDEGFKLPSLGDLRDSLVRGILAIVSAQGSVEKIVVKEENASQGPAGGFAGYRFSMQVEGNPEVMAKIKLQIAQAQAAVAQARADAEAKRAEAQQTRHR